MSTITQFPSGNTLYRIEFDYLARTFVVVNNRRHNVHDYTIPFRKHSVQD
nr:MAG TPA_asm: hypothetical protein [Bacteriophage sp.]